MKPFNLKEAKAGKPVCTRDGKDVRIICYDWKNPSSISIIALVKEEKDGESIQKYTQDGRYYADGSECDADLFMKPEKHEGWVNVYKKDGSKRYVDKQLFNTSVEAMNYGEKWNSYITTTKIEWEE